MSVFSFLQTKELNLRTKLKKGLQTKLTNIPINMIISDKYNIRDLELNGDLDKLLRNVRDYGVLQPIVVKKLENGVFEVVSGHRRFLAAKAANFEKIPAVVTNECDKKLPFVFLAENLNHKKLSCFEEADAIFRLVDEYHFTQEMISDALGVTQSFVADRLKLLKLKGKVRNKIILSDLTVDYALLITMIDKESDQLEIIDEIVKNKLGISQAENLIFKCINSDGIGNFGNVDRCSWWREQTNNETIYIVKDIRFFDNTISQAISMMNRSGMEAVSVKSESSHFIEYVIKIPKEKVYMKKSS